MSQLQIQYLSPEERAEAIRLLCTTDPDVLEANGVDNLLPAFKRAATKVPAYKKILEQHGVNYKDIKDVESYKRLVPVIDKESTFPVFEIEDLCVDGSLEMMKTAMTSSGFSGVFSYGINTPRNYRDIAKSIDTALDYIFDITHKNTLLISVVPMGVKITTSLRLAETSVRPDMALAIIKKFSPKFDQTVIVGDPHFLKKLVEDGRDQGIDWKKIKASLVFGEDWFSESFRSYLGHLMDFDPDKPDDRIIFATMGVAELDLNLFHESRHSIQLRRLAQRDVAFREALFGKGTKVPPELYHYYPHRIFLEAVSENGIDKELVFSMLSPNMLIPLMRYNSRDRGDVIPYKKLEEILTKTGHLDMLPDLKLPMVWLGGRKDRFMEVDGKQLLPEEIKQGLYEDFEVASLTTGYFRLNKKDISLEIQLKKGVNISDMNGERLRKALFKYTERELPIVIYEYQKFPYGMELDYEKKFYNV